MDADSLMALLAIFNVILIAVIGAIWKHKNDAHKAMWDRIVAAENNLNNFKLEVAKEYVSSAAMDKIVARLEKSIVDGLHEVSASLNKLADEFHDHQLGEKGTK